MKFNLSLHDKLALTVVAIFILISIVKINEPGVTSDQLLFVNAAIGPLDQSWIYKSVHGVPLFLMVYIGALKSYLYKPIFALFGVSIYSIRIPIILIMAAALFILYKALCLKVNPKIALWTILILATDPSNIAYTRVDNGPTVLEFSFKCLSLLFTFLYFKTKKSKYVYLLLLFLGLGLFNKVNFVWFINSLFFGLAIFYREFFLEKKKLIIAYLLFLTYGILILKKATAVYAVTTIPLSILGLQNHILNVATTLVNLANGEVFFSFIYGQSPHSFTFLYSAVLFLLNLFGLIYFIKQRRQVSSVVTKFYFFIFAIFLTTLVQLVLTFNAISGWHIYAVYPFFQIMTVMIIYQLGLSKKRIAYVLLGLMILYNLFTYSIYISNYGQPVKNLAWSDKFYDLVLFTDPYPGIVLSTDVGIQTNLLTFSKNYQKYTPIEWMVDTNSYASYAIALQGYFKKDKNILVIVTNPEMAILKGIQPNFFRFIREFKINLIKIKEFYEGDRVIYTVYRVQN